MLTKFDDEIKGKSFAFVIIKRIFDEEEGDAAAKYMHYAAVRCGEEEGDAASFKFHQRSKGLLINFIIFIEKFYFN